MYEKMGTNETIKTIADEILNEPVVAITSRTFETPSHDPHDYVSRAPYWYVEADGTVVRKDGQINPESKLNSDKDTMLRARNNVMFLTVAALETQATGDNPSAAAYAEYVERTLKTWFVDEATRMNPNLEYAQMKPKETTGNFYGIIEGDALMRFVEVTVALENKGLLKDPETATGVKDWFEKYLNWLENSDKGKREKVMANNHSTFYAAQVAQVADFVGDREAVVGALEYAKALIDRQVAEDGSMPEELKRHEGGVGYDYQLFNLYGFIKLAEISEKYGADLDLWHYKSSKGVGLEDAFEYFVKKELPKAGEHPFKMDRTGELYLTFRAAAKAYNNEGYYDLPAKYFTNELADRLTSSDTEVWMH
ncbi:MAG: alginate lyase family protein [Patescibacteria group bacterium]